MAGYSKVIERNPEADLYPATRGPWDYQLDGEIRNARMDDPGRFGNSEREDLGELIELNQFVGHEAWDYQNPYAFASMNVLDYPSPFGTQLAAGVYGLGDSGQAETDVAINIRATANAIMKN